MINQSSAFTILLLYTLMISYYYFFDMAYDFHMITTTIMVVVLIAMNSSIDKLTDEMKDIGKFIGHLLFISLVLHLVWCIFHLTFSTIFYFGFFNTITYTLIFTFMGISGITKFIDKHYLSKSNIGQQFLTVINNYYNIYFVSKNWSNTIKTYLTHIYQNYVKIYGLFIFQKLWSVNTDLSDNSKTKIVMNKLDEKYVDAKQCLFQQCFEPYFFKMVNDTINNDPFTLKPIKLENMYKNPKLNTDMNFLQESQMDNVEDSLDDLNDEDTLKVETPIVPPLKLPPTTNNETKPIVNNRNALRKKIAAKKMERSNRNKYPPGPPGMDKMMETMLQGDNLKKIMEQFPPDKIQQQDVDPEQVRQMMQMMMKNTKK